MKYKTRYLIALLFLWFSIFYLLVINPSISEFDYWHMASAKIIEKTGFIDMDKGKEFPFILSEGLISFYTFIISMALVSNISYDILPSVPLMSLPLIFFLIAILKNICDNKEKCYLISLVLVFIYITQSSFPRFGLFPHNVGFILFLAVILLTIYVDKNKNRHAASLLLIITMISLNFMSYKLTFYMIVFIIFMSIVNKRSFVLIALISIIFTFSFNKFLYNTFLPTMKMASDLRSSFGVEKLFSLLSNKLRNPNDPLSEYYLNTPIEIKYAYIFWLLIVIIGLILSTAYIIKKYIKREKFSVGDNIVLGLNVSSISIFSIYNILGLADVSFLIFTGIVGYIIVFQFRSKNYKRLVLVNILLLLVLNIYANIETVHYDHYIGQKDKNYFQYMNPVTKWYFRYITNDFKNHTVTDVLTRGYFMKEVVKNNISDNYHPELFSRDHISLLLKPENVLIEKNSDFKFYEIRSIVNYREEPYFSIGGWDNFNSWSNYKKIIEANKYVKNIYSSGDVDILLYQP